LIAFCVDWNSDIVIDFGLLIGFALGG